jgi:protein SCO1
MKYLRSAFPVLLVVAGLVIYFVQRPHAFYGTAVEPPIPTRDFTLESAAGPISLSDYRGKFVILYFGYTFCPDVCPATLGNLKQALKTIGSRAHEVQTIMVSLDPERDTPQRLSEYLTHFDPSFLGITGTQETLKQITSDNGIYFEKEAGSSPDNYSIDHTASLIVLDREQNLVLLIPFGNTPDQIADDLQYLLK